MPIRNPNARPEEQILADRAKVAELLLKGWTYDAIARHLNLTIDMVRHDAEKLREGWRTNALINVGDMINMELARLDLIERQCWEAWEASKQEFTRQVQKIGPANRNGKQKKIPSVEIIGGLMQKENRHGDPRYLALILHCSAERRKLLGLDATISGKGATDDKGAETLAKVIYLPELGTETPPPPDAIPPGAATLSAKK